MNIVRMRFKSAVRIGADQQGIGKEKTQEIIHSDTVFSMLVNAYAEIVNNKNSEIESFIQSIEGLSSGFLFEEILEGKYVYYLPRPLLYPPNFLDSKFGLERKKEHIKHYKDCFFIEYDEFLKWSSGRNIDITKLEKSSYKRLYTIRLRPHHVRDRLTNATTIYHIGEMFLEQNSGIYFLVDSKDLEILDKVLHHASINGIGGRRCSLGSFEYKIDELDNIWKNIFAINGNGFIIISLFYPHENERDDFTIKKDNIFAYELIPRKGWIFSSVVPYQFKRKSCWMFSEGSVFGKKPNGSIVDVTPNAFSAHKIYRFGRCISLPYRIYKEVH